MTTLCNFSQQKKCLMSLSISPFFVKKKNSSTPISATQTQQQVVIKSELIIIEIKAYHRTNGSNQLDKGHEKSHGIQNKHHSLVVHPYLFIKSLSFPFLFLYEDVSCIKEFQQIHCETRKSLDFDCLAALLSPDNSPIFLTCKN